MGKATIDIKGLVSNVELLGNASRYSIKSIHLKVEGVLPAVTYIQSEDKNEKMTDQEKKEIRDLIKKINSVVECFNAYFPPINLHSKIVCRDCM